MKLLMLTPRFPYPPTRGDAVRAWGELEYLAARHDVWLASLADTPPAPTALEHVRQRCRDVAVVSCAPRRALLRGALTLARGGSLMAGYFADARLTRVLDEWAAQVGFDAVLTFSAALAPLAARVPAGRRVLDMNDVDSLKWRRYAASAPVPLRWLYGLEARRFARVERAVGRSHGLVLLVNERERRKAESAEPTLRTEVLRTPVPGIATTLRPVPARPVVGMVGSMFYPPNVRAVQWFGRHVWPLVRRACPAAEWWIVGADPVAAVRRWARAPGVTVTGRVPDVAPYLAQMRVFANPVTGDLGVQTKLLMALGAGCASVVTPDVAAGIDRAVGRPFLVAAAPDTFAATVLKLLGDNALVAEVGRQALALVGAHYTPQGEFARLERWLAGDAAPSSGRFVADTPCPCDAVTTVTPAQEVAAA